MSDKPKEEILMAIDQSLIRTDEEVGEFSHFLTDCGAGICSSRENMENFMSDLVGLPFRIVLSADKQWVNIMVRPENMQSRQEAANTESMRDFLKILPTLIVVAILSTLAVGGITYYRVAVTGAIYGWETNPMLGAMLNGGIWATVWIGCIIYWFARKGRA